MLTRQETTNIAKQNKIKQNNTTDTFISFNIFHFSNNNIYDNNNNNNMQNSD